jgi:hypothetical protein
MLDIALLLVAVLELIGLIVIVFVMALLADYGRG